MKHSHKTSSIWNLRAAPIRTGKIVPLKICLYIKIDFKYRRQNKKYHVHFFYDDLLEDPFMFIQWGLFSSRKCFFWWMNGTDFKKYISSSPVSVLFVSGQIYQWTEKSSRIHSWTGKKHKLMLSWIFIVNFSIFHTTGGSIHLTLQSYFILGENKWSTQKVSLVFFCCAILDTT